ncbi:hypothetical protein HKX48_007205 [Thoreauomyces humboldtii]|nr:hypothetical protein HKX48_007205 [Thoreauomyces humboldtii]
MAESKKVITTYSYGPDSEEAGSAFAEELESRLPLRNVSWQNPLGFSKGSSSSARVIDTLDVDLKKYVPEMFPRVMPGTLYHSPYFLHLYLVSTDDTELYKGVVRKQIQEWLNVVANKKNQEWLIVYLNKADTKGKTKGFLGVGASSVFDKVKSDFNFKKERCIRMKLQNDPSKDAEAWAELLSHLKEGVTSSLNQQIVQYDEDTRRFDQQRLMPGWNYCQYFVMKEGLAYTFEFMNLIDEALLQYDELEASFFQTLSEQGAPWFAKFGGTDPEDDSADILNLKRKPYRNMIMQNTVSIFDFRVYLFARQCQLLFRMGYAVDICQRAKAFINQFARNIQENEVSLHRLFRPTWVYSACMSVIGNCDELVAVSTMAPHMISIYDGAKVDLLQCARMQLDSLGVTSGMYNSDEAPLAKADDAAAETLAPSPEWIEECSNKITSAELKGALMSVQAFDELFLDAQNLNSRGRYAEAASTWEGLVDPAAEGSWPFLDDIFAEKMALCWKMLEREEKYLQSCLHLVLASSSHERIQYYIDELVRTAGKLTQVVQVENCSIVTPKVGSVVNEVKDDGGLVIHLAARTRLQEVIPFDEVRLRLLGSDGTEFFCTAASTPIQGATTSVALLGEKLSVSGTYIVENVTFRVGKLKLVYRDLGAYSITGSALPIRISAGLPDQTTSGDAISNTQNMQIKLFTRDDGIQGGALSIASTSIVFPASKFTLFRTSSIADAGRNVKECTLDTVDGKVALPATEPFEVVTFLVPYQVTNNMDCDEHKVSPDVGTIRLIHHGQRAHVSIRQLKMSFTLTNSNGKRSIWAVTERANLDRHFIVNHSIIDNPTSPIAQYQLQGTGANPVRITSVLPYASGDVTHVACSEMQETTLDAMLAARELTHYTGCLMHYIKDIILPSIDVVAYGYRDVLSVPPLNLVELHAALRSERPDTILEIEDFIRSFHQVC